MIKMRTFFHCDKTISVDNQNKRTELIIFIEKYINVFILFWAISKLGFFTN